MLEGKLALIAGVANKRSIAWGIAEELHRQGAKLAFTYQGERVEKNVRELAATVGSDLCVEMDARDDASIKAAFTARHGGVGGLARVSHDLLLRLYLDTDEHAELGKAFAEKRKPDRGKFGR